MKKLLLAAAAMVCLTSCMNVGDFGAYWEKAGLDPQLFGTWVRVAANPSQTRERGYPIGDIMRVTERNGALEEAFTVDGKPSPEAPFYAKTLAVGGYQMVIVGPRKGFIERYKVSPQTLQLCAFDHLYLAPFVKTNYPRTFNLEVVQGEVKVNLFDDEVYRIVSNIPDTEEYWDCDVRSERVP